LRSTYALKGNPKKEIPKTEIPKTEIPKTEIPKTEIQKRKPGFRNPPKGVKGIRERHLAKRGPRLRSEAGLSQHRRVAKIARGTD
jgi:hypothetical protein